MYLSTNDYQSMMSSLDDLEWPSTCLSPLTNQKPLKMMKQPSISPPTKTKKAPRGSKKPYPPCVLCTYPNCDKRRQSGPAKRCIAHGGGFECKQKGCSRRTVNKSYFCFIHDESLQCVEPGCTHRRALKGGDTTRCVTHGGGARCTLSPCNRHARSGKFCDMHNRQIEVAKKLQHLACIDS